MPKHFLSISDFSKEEIDSIFENASSIESRWLTPDVRRNNFCLASFFAEASTRTRFSFERAMHWLGGNVITDSYAGLSSSLSKGESLKDTFRTLSQYSDIIVMRHHNENWPDEARKYSRVPVINAGSGSGEHPTQALLDLYTIKQKFNNLQGLKVMMCGDLKNGRTIHSLAQLLTSYGCELFACPARTADLDKFNIPTKYKVKCNSVEIEDADNVLPDMDVIYMTRIQKERIDHDSRKITHLHRSAWESYYDEFQLNSSNIDLINENAIILHPLPRNKEISEDIDEDPRAIYHEKQIRNGMYIRTAILQQILNSGIS